jgi:hypothetical protein
MAFTDNIPGRAIAQFKEVARQKQNKDDYFYKRLLYYFELRVPTSIAAQIGNEPFLFPLVIPPQNYSMSEPFAVEVTQTQGGGVYVEENGIIVRTIRLSGHTGWRPRTLPLKRSVALSLEKTDKNYSRALQPTWVGALSGQRHFQYLQDSVFRTYGDLKRNPETAADTKLIFHNPRDQEDWEVIPQRFDLTRTAGEPLLYRYDIELLAVGPAEDVKADFSEDQSVFDAIKDKLAWVKAGADWVRGAVSDLTALVNEVRLYVQNINVILDSVNAILKAVDDFLDGSTVLIQAPYAFLETTIDIVENALEIENSAQEMRDAAGAISNFPEVARQKLRQVQDGLERLGTTPEKWERGNDTVMEDIRRFQEMRRRVSAQRRAEARAGVSPATFNDLRNWGSKLTPGEEIAIDGEFVIGGETFKFRSARLVVVGQGDTLMSLAAQYLGDARKWQYIAIINGLQPPFTNAQASAPLVGVRISGTTSGVDAGPFPQAIGVGSKILIPSNQISVIDLPVLPIAGVQLNEPAENHLLGVDFALEVAVGHTGERNARYDIAIDIDMGSVDAKLVEGRANIKQAVFQRLVIDRGTDTLYKNVGLRRVVGLGLATVDIEMARFRVVEAVRADPRIVGVEDVAFNVEDDIFETDLTVSVRGSAESIAIKAAV